MSCPQFEKLIALYVEGDLSPRKAGRVEEHLAACGHCREFAEGLRRSQAALKSLRAEMVDPAVFEGVRRRVLAQIAARPVSRGWWKYAAVAATFIIIVALFWKPNPPPAPPPPVAQLKPPVTVEPPVPSRAPAKHLAVRRKPRPKTSQEPLLVKLVTDDPNIVIYWLIEPKESGL
jgi:hypothetical protein